MSSNARRLNVTYFSFCCPVCGKCIRAEEQWRGLRAYCPKCGIAIAVPVPSQISDMRLYLQEKLELFRFRNTIPSPHVNWTIPSLSFKWVIGLIVILTGIFFFSHLFQSDSREHDRRLAQIEGRLSLNESAWAYPSSKIAVSKKDRYGLVAYSPKQSSFYSQLEDGVSISFEPRFERSPDGTKNILIYLYSVATLGEKCTIDFVSGITREYEIKFLRKNGPPGSKMPSYYTITLSPEEYYLYFIKDTPERITLKAFTKFMMRTYHLRGRPHEFDCFKTMSEFFKI